MTTTTDPYSRPAPVGHAYATIGTKTGAGRSKSPKPGAKHVEQSPCPARDGGYHELFGDENALMACVHCAVEWWLLDAELRTKPAPAEPDTCACGARLIATMTWRKTPAAKRAVWHAEGARERVGDECATCSRRSARGAS